MYVQLTDAGAAALNAGTGPITLTTYKLGSAYNYVPEATDTDIHGTLVEQGAPSQPQAVSANLVRYSILLDFTLGPFQFGEVGIYMANGELFALAADNVLIQKLKMTSANTGNAIRLDIYLSMVGTNYDMWLSVGESNNEFRLAVIQSPDVLPISNMATPNAYVVQPASQDQKAMLAYTDRNGLWLFDCYDFINQMSATITGFDSHSVTIALSEYTTDMSPDYFGQLILEFTSGAIYSTCRYIKTAVISGSTVTLGFNTPVAMTPAVGDTVVIFSRDSLSTSNVILPIASDTTLGGIKVGPDFDIDSTGVLSLNPTSVVLSVNDKVGVVELGIDDIPDAAPVAKTNSYNDLDDKPAAYVLPPASTTVLGGIKIPTNGHFTMTDGVLDYGFTVVESVNGVSPDEDGNIELPASTGLTNPLAIPANTNLNNIVTDGLYYTTDDSTGLVNAPTATGILEVVVYNSTGLGGAGDSIMQRWSTGGTAYVRTRNVATWSAWSQLGGTIPAATTSSLGVVQVGDRLEVTPGGILSSLFNNVNGKTMDETGTITLEAADVGALSAAAVGTPGNLPGFLTDQSGTPTDPDWYYQNGRIPDDQLSKGVYYQAGTWNASNGTVTAAPDGWVINSLKAGGVINITVEGPTGTFNTVDVNAEGMIFRVDTAGNTALDSNTAWQVGELLQSRNGVWTKIAEGFPGGYAGPLTRGSGAATDNDYFFNNARLPGSQLPINSVYICGTLNGNTGAIVGVVRGDYTYKSLAPNGNVVITITNAAGVSNDVTVNARGRMFQVQDTGGNFAIDGITQWAIGDQAISLNGQWRRWSSTAVRSVQGIIADANGDVALTRTAVSNAINGALEGRTTAGAANSLSLYAVGNNPLYLNLGGGNTVYFGNGAGGTVAYVDNAGNGVFTNATALSDVTKKKNFEPVTEAMKKVMGIDVFTYELIEDDSERRYVGISAQSLQAVQPEAIMERNDGTLGVNIQGHVALLTKALQEANERLVILERYVKQLVSNQNLNKGE